MSFISQPTNDSRISAGLILGKSIAEAAGVREIGISNDLHSDVETLDWGTEIGSLTRHIDQDGKDHVTSDLRPIMQTIMQGRMFGSIPMRKRSVDLSINEDGMKTRLIGCLQRLCYLYSNYIWPAVMEQFVNDVGEYYGTTNPYFTRLNVNQDVFEIQMLGRTGSVIKPSDRVRVDAIRARIVTENSDPQSTLIDATIRLGAGNWSALYGLFSNGDLDTDGDPNIPSVITGDPLPYCREQLSHLSQEMVDHFAIIVDMYSYSDPSTQAIPSSTYREILVKLANHFVVMWSAFKDVSGFDIYRPMALILAADQFIKDIQDRLSTIQNVLRNYSSMIDKIFGRTTKGLISEPNMFFRLIEVLQDIRGAAVASIPSRAASEPTYSRGFTIPVTAYSGLSHIENVKQGYAFSYNTILGWARDRVQSRMESIPTSTNTTNRILSRNDTTALTGISTQLNIPQFQDQYNNLVKAFSAAIDGNPYSSLISAVNGAAQYVRFLERTTALLGAGSAAPYRAAMKPLTTALNTTPVDIDAAIVSSVDHGPRSKDRYAAMIADGMIRHIMNQNLGSANLISNSVMVPSLTWRYGIIQVWFSAVLIGLSVQMAARSQMAMMLGGVGVNRDPIYRPWPVFGYINGRRRGDPLLGASGQKASVISSRRGTLYQSIDGDDPTNDNQKSMTLSHGTWNKLVDGSVLDLSENNLGGDPSDHAVLSTGVQDGLIASDQMIYTTLVDMLYSKRDDGSVGVDNISKKQISIMDPVTENITGSFGSFTVGTLSRNYTPERPKQFKYVNYKIAGQEEPVSAPIPYFMNDSELAASMNPLVMNIQDNQMLVQSFSITQGMKDNHTGIDIRGRSIAHQNHSSIFAMLPTQYGAIIQTRVCTEAQFVAAADMYDTLQVNNLTADSPLGLTDQQVADTLKPTDNALTAICGIINISGVDHFILYVADHLGYTTPDIASRVTAFNTRLSNDPDFRSMHNVFYLQREDGSPLYTGSSIARRFRVDPANTALTTLSDSDTGRSVGFIQYAPHLIDQGSLLPGDVAGQVWCTGRTRKESQYLRPASHLHYAIALYPVHASWITGRNLTLTVDDLNTLRSAGRSRAYVRNESFTQNLINLNPVLAPTYGTL